MRLPRVVLLVVLAATVVAFLWTPERGNKSRTGATRPVPASGGRVVFAGEPISRKLNAPWGLRMDGESLWAIRTNGWLELGFRRSYFLQALERYGWVAKRVTCLDTPSGEIFVARRHREI